jgi:glutaredoxin-related protein
MIEEKPLDAKKMKQIEFTFKNPSKAEINEFVNSHENSFEKFMQMQQKQKDFKNSMSMGYINQNYFSVQERCDKILEQFENGIERYQKDALFNKCVQSLSHNCSEFEVINDLITIINSQQEQLKHNAIYGVPTLDTKAEICKCAHPEPNNDLIDIGKFIFCYNCKHIIQPEITK